MAEQQKHGVPAILSLLMPGLGQIVKGQLMKGIGHIVVLAISGALTIIGIGVILVPLVWIYSVYDAYNN